MLTVTKRDLVVECSEHRGTDQIDSSYCSNCSWLRRPAGMVTPAVLLLLTLGANQQVRKQTFTALYSFDYTERGQSQSPA